VQSDPSFYLLRIPGIDSRANVALAKLQADVMPCADRERERLSLAVRYPPASYWLGDVKEMAAINTILIIVNSLRR
jgi:hypothetical protein